VSLPACLETFQPIVCSSKLVAKWLSRTVDRFELEILSMLRCNPRCARTSKSGRSSACLHDAHRNGLAMPPLVAPLALATSTSTRCATSMAKARVIAPPQTSSPRLLDKMTANLWPWCDPLMLSVVWVASNRSGGGHLRSNRGVIFQRYPAYLANAP